MTQIRAAAVAILLMLAVTIPARTPDSPNIADLKREAIAEVDKLRVLTQQMVDQNVQTREIKYTPLINTTDQPAIELNKEKMERFRPELKKYYYDSAKYKTYLEQLGIQYPTVKK